MADLFCAHPLCHPPPPVPSSHPTQADINKSKRLARSEAVGATPTFCVYEGGERRAFLEGADAWDKVERLVRKLAAKAGDGSRRRQGDSSEPMGRLGPVCTSAGCTDDATSLGLAAIRDGSGKKSVRALQDAISAGFVVGEAGVDGEGGTALHAAAAAGNARHVEVKFSRFFF